MGKESICDWCGELIIVVVRNGRPAALENGRPHRCRDHAVGATFSTGTRKLSLGPEQYANAARMRNAVRKK